MNSFLIALSIYSLWNITVISDRVTRYSIKKHPVRYTLDVIYFILMVFYLSQASHLFLGLGLLTLVLHIAFGVYIEMLRPEIRSRGLETIDIMNNYWNFLIIDAVVTLLSYGIVIAGKV